VWLLVSGVMKSPLLINPGNVTRYSKINLTKLDEVNEVEMTINRS
jgi:hypothetical protein